MLDKFMPGLDAELSTSTLADLERPGNPGLAAFKAAGGAGLLVPAEHGGLGASPDEALRVQRAVAARSPSLAVATTMHHFSVASLVEAGRAGTGFEWMLLEGIARDRLLLASGFAEGQTGAAILSPTMRARRQGKHLLVSGIKRPCSLSRSMDLLTASVAVTDEDGRERMAVVLVPAGSPGLKVRPFWNTFVLAGAESDEVELSEVQVPANLAVFTDTTADQRLDELQTSGFLWFELLITASYLGVASALVERALTTRASADERAWLIIEAEAAMTTLDGVALAMRDGRRGEAMFARVLCARYAVQEAVGRIARRAVELLGGVSYLSSDEVGYLAAASAALLFHPPSRTRMTGPICDYFTDGPLRVG